MLVLTRKQEEKICIGDEIVITLLRVKGKSIRLGIEAPDKVCVLRGELVFDAPADKQASSNSGNSTDAIRKQTGSRGKKNAGQVAATDTPLPQTNVCHAPNSTRELSAGDCFFAKRSRPVGGTHGKSHLDPVGARPAGASQLGCRRKTHRGGLAG